MIGLKQNENLKIMTSDEILKNTSGKIIIKNKLRNINETQVAK